VSFDQREWKIVPESHCTGREKPSTSMSCFTENCGSNWFTSEWLPVQHGLRRRTMTEVLLLLSLFHFYLQCSRSCDLGVQKRDVKCLNEVLKPSLDCSESNKPPARRSCNLSQCVNSYSGIPYTRLPMRFRFE